MTDPFFRGTWKQARNRPRGDLICGLVDGRLFHLSDRYTTDQHAHLHDPIADTAVEIAPPPWRAEYPKAIGTAEGWIAMLGGEVDNEPTARCLLYEPSTNVWHEMPPIPAPCHRPEAVLVGGRIFVVSPTGNVWSWAPGEEWRIHPDLPEAVARESVAVRGVAGSVVVWSRSTRGALVRLDGEQWNTLTTLDKGVEIQATEDGLRAIGGVEEATHGRIQEWRPAGWIAGGELAKPRCNAIAVRLTDGRTVVLSGDRYDHYMEDNSTGGELDLEYRSFSQTRKYGLVECEDLELETSTGWISLHATRKFGWWPVIHPLSDGRLCVAQKSAPGWGYYPETHVWTPP